MAKKGVYFNGRLVTHPGAYAMIDGEQMVGLSNDSEKLLVIMGNAEGGIPQDVMWFDNPISAKKILRGGELLKACEKAWEPDRNRSGGGASVIGVIRTNNATRATLS